MSERYWRKVQDLKAKLAAFRGTPTPAPPKRPRISGPREHVADCVGCGELLIGWRLDMGSPRCMDCKAKLPPSAA